ncbi:MAG: PepSY-associated TM helix domain-containing protein [Azospirillaceae bacterium]|nr:PepSY-associated TM helix domain-containing protein [Azospirillaceae bacterium]
MSGWQEIEGTGTQAHAPGRAHGMSASSIRTWGAVHKWTSLVCTLFLLVICLTGLPLVFRDEIDGWLSDDPPYATLPANAPLANIDGLVAKARALHPDRIVTSLFMDDDEPKVVVFMTPSWPAFLDPDNRTWVKFDSRTGDVLAESPPPGQQKSDFLSIMLNLHMDLFAGLPGELFMGFMALLFVVAIVSGVVLYGPFTRKLDFGTVRTRRTRRVRWLDLHNLLGVTTLAWALVVGATGVMNELSTPLFGLWQMTDVRAILAPWQGKPSPSAEELAPVETALANARAALPGMATTSVVFPGSPFGSPQHYVIWTKGDTTLTSRLLTPVLAAARTGAVDVVAPMPWYLRALEVSRPLHFGDYGGMPLKILWALLDVVTIIVLASGLYLWIARRRTGAGAADADGAALN